MLNKIDKVKIYGKAVVSSYSITNAGKSLLTERCGKSLTAFSLAEMMVVMLIMSIVLAAMAPVITTRIKADEAIRTAGIVGGNDENNPWAWTENSDTDAFSKADRNMIGQKKLGENDGDAKLILNQTGTNKDHILFKKENDILGHLKINKKFLQLGTFLSEPATPPDHAVVVGFDVSGTPGDYSVAIGTTREDIEPRTPLISGLRAVSIGNGTQANGNNSVAIGPKPVASGLNAIAIGYSTQASGDNSLAMMRMATASNTSAIAIGTNVATSGLRATSIGTFVSASGNNSISIGVGKNEETPIVAAGQNSIAIGKETSSTADNSLSIGTSSIASGANAISIGSSPNYNTKSEGNNSIAIGFASQALTKNAIAIGPNSRARVYDATIAIGPSALTEGKNGLSLGSNSQAGGENSIAVGNKAISSLFDSIAIGQEAKSNGNYSIAIGPTAQASGYSTIALGFGSVGSGKTAMAIGTGAEASGENSVVLGNYANSSLFDSIAIGQEAKSNENYSIAIGSEAQVSGYSTIALGFRSVGSGKTAMAIGISAQAAGENSVVLGNYANSSLFDSIAIGQESESKGNYSIAIGPDSISNYSESIAIGHNVEATGDHDFVLGTVLHKVRVPGTLTVSRTLTVKGTEVTSDKRLKYIKGENKNGLDKIRQMKIYNFTFKKDKDKEPRVGVIAQELQKILPDAVKKGSDGFLTIRIDDIIYTLVNAVKELDRKVSELTQTLKQVQAEQKRINKRLDTLEQKSVH